MNKFDCKDAIDKGICFLKEQFKLAGIDKAVLGLSGGLDSAVVAYLLVRALGKDRVEAIKMPYRSSSKASVIDANLVIKALGIKSREIDISRSVDSFTNEGISPLRLGNVMARVRMIYLFDIAAECGGIVIGTSNRSELLLGYGTLFGDLASIINPIAPFFKTEIFEMAKALEVPQPLIDKKPSADLWENQSDEDELGFSYEVADFIIKHGFETDRRDLAIEKYGDELVEKVLNRVKANQFKFKVPIKLEL